MVKVLCLLISYYYGYVACFRYYDGVDQNNFFIVACMAESVFLVHLLLQFLVEFTPEGSKQPVTDISRISMNYIHGDFAMDVIPLIPFFVVKMPRNRHLLLNIIKMTRIIKGFDLFNVQRINAFVKNYFNYKMLKLIENDPLFADDKDVDNNRI